MLDKGHRPEGKYLQKLWACIHLPTMVWVPKITPMHYSVCLHTMAIQSCLVHTTDCISLLVGHVIYHEQWSDNAAYYKHSMHSLSCVVWCLVYSICISQDWQVCGIHTTLLYHLSLHSPVLSLVPRLSPHVHKWPLHSSNPVLTLLRCEGSLEMRLVSSVIAHCMCPWC